MCTMGHVGNIGCGDPRMAYRFGGVKFPSHMDTTTTILYMCTTDVQKYNGMVYKCIQ